MFKWIDKQDDIDFVLAKDINAIAHGLIALREDMGEGVVDQNYNPKSENAQSGKALASALAPIETDIGDINTALDNIIEIQNLLIGGDNE